MPAHFDFGGEFDVLLPLRIDAARLVPLFRLNGVARMKPGVTLAQANADIARMLEIYFDKFRVNTARAVRWCRHSSRSSRICSATWARRYGS